jgi:hypothetical protein
MTEQLHGLAMPPSEAEAQVALSAPTQAFLDRLHVVDPEHRLADPTYRAETLCAATPEELLDGIRSVNTALYGAENPVFDRQTSLQTGEGMDRKVNYIGLEPHDAREVFMYGLTEAQRIVREQGPEALPVAADLRAGTIAGTQMFHDGNKRTSRAEHLLLTHGYDGSQEDMQMYEAVLGGSLSTGSMGYRPDASASIRTTLLEETDESTRKQVDLFDVAVQNHFSDRSKLDALLAPNIHDETLRDKAVSVLQQYLFGAKHLVDIIGYVPEVHAPGPWAVNSETAADALAAAERAVRAMTPEVAAEMIQRDNQAKKRHLLRLIDATTGAKPLPFIRSDGKVSTTHRITIAGEVPI